MIFLVDYNLDGYAIVLLGIMAKRGWLDLLSIRFVTFKETELLIDSSDLIVWHYAQVNPMIIFTANRNMKGKSLEQVMREENTSNCFPVVTIENLDRLDEYIY